MSAKRKVAPAHDEPQEAHDEEFLADQVLRIRALAERMSRMHKCVTGNFEAVNRSRKAARVGPLERVRDYRVCDTHPFEPHSARREKSRSAPAATAHDATPRSRRRR